MAQCGAWRSRLDGALGAATDVEVSAVGDKPQDFEMVGLLFDAAAEPEAQRDEQGRASAAEP